MPQGKPLWMQPCFPRTLRLHLIPPGSNELPPCSIEDTMLLCLLLSCLKAESQGFLNAAVRQ